MHIFGAVRWTVVHLFHESRSLIVVIILVCEVIRGSGLLRGKVMDVGVLSDLIALFAVDHFGS